MAVDVVRISKFFSLVLRHKPEAIGLTLDQEGWAEISDLIACAARNGRKLDRSVIEHVVATNDKKRFTISADGRRIRAAQGHSTPAVSLSYAAQVPPPVLYHGTATRFLESILAEGLKPGSRHHVHLSPDLDTAVKVGIRHGKPLVLIVDAQKMHRDGHTFFLSDNGVWLTPNVPAEFLSVHQSDGSSTK